MKRAVKKIAPADHRLRIIAGRWRGRKLPIPTADGLRPTGDRLRETLFNWLAPVLPGAHCLDLYAGTGALGLEALSRGAASATMIETQPDAVAQLRANRSTLAAETANVVQADALGWLRQQRGQKFDLIFIDPPFAAGLWQNTIDLLEKQALLTDGAFIYVETPRDTHVIPPDNWTLYRQKTAGAVCVRLFTRAADSGTGHEGDKECSGTVE